MSESPPRPPVPPVPAATVLLVRDARDGVETFMVERSGFGMFGGLHVFPGGKVDPADRAPDWEPLAQGLDDASASATLGVDEGGLGYWVACIRECFEEAGVLLAARADGELLPLEKQTRRERFAAWRERLNAGTAEVFHAMCHEERLTLATDHLAFVSHWITPVGQPKRFDTRFFVARTPAAQEALHDGFEAVESHWIRPEVALDRYARGELNLISPTFKNLEAIAGYDSTERLLEAKRAVDPATIPTILPRVKRRDDAPADVGPADPAAYSEILERVDRHGRALAEADAD